MKEIIFFLAGQISLVIENHYCDGTKAVKQERDEICCSSIYWFGTFWNDDLLSVSNMES